MATNERVFNFSAGPSTLPVEVLEKAAAEMLNYEGTGAVSSTHLMWCRDDCHDQIHQAGIRQQYRSYCIIYYTPRSV